MQNKRKNNTIKKNKYINSSPESTNHCLNVIEHKIDIILANLQNPNFEPTNTSIITCFWANITEQFIVIFSYTFMYLLGMPLY